jgi:4'-phosphopantetheinyl transferase
MSTRSLDIRLGKLAALPADLPSYWDMLDSDEQHRAHAIKNPQRQAFYVETHARLRLLLSKTVDTAPAQLRFTRNDHGKPFLADFPEIAFNLSHTADWIAVAIGYRCRLGIDIESCKPRTNLAALVEKCFGAEEKAAWQALPEAAQRHAFYQFWTRKEAFVKAVGRGIGLGLHHCVIDPSAPGKMRHVPPSCAPAGDWFLHDLDVDIDVCGAIAADRPIGAITIQAL